MLFLQFEFINSYLSLFYIGFYLKDMERLKEVTTFAGVSQCIRVLMGWAYEYLNVEPTWTFY